MNEEKRALVITKNDFRERMDGGSKRTAAMVDALRNDNWRVDWVAAKPFVWHAENPIRKNRIHRLAGVLLALVAILKSPSLSSLKWFSFQAASKIRELTRCNDYHVVIIDHTQIAAYIEPARAREAIVNMHNIESELLSNYSHSVGFTPRGVVARVEAFLMRRIERRLVNGDRTIVTVSGHDASLLRDLTPRSGRPIVVAPNGVDDEFFHVEGVPDDVVVFIGHLGWRPNADGARWLTREVWPDVARKNRELRLHLVGRNPSTDIKALNRNEVHVFANVPSIIPHLASAACATAPLLSAGGTRIKILEALAAGVPVVSTSLGALGLEHLASEHFLIADNPADFANNVRHLSRSRFDREAVRAAVGEYRWSCTLGPIIEEANHHYARRSEPMS